MTKMADRIQHVKPCGECPFRRCHPPGWLGGSEVDDFIGIATGERFHDCHKRTSFQCAGVGIMRANMGKLPRNEDLLVLEKDHEGVFSNAVEFWKHHTGGPK